VNFKKSQLNILNVEPKELSLISLMKKIHFLYESDLNFSDVAYELIKRFTKPLMLFLVLVIIISASYNGNTRNQSLIKEFGIVILFMIFIVFTEKLISIITLKYMINPFFTNGFILSALGILANHFFRKIAFK